MRWLSIDLETYSDLDIKKAGAYRYAENCEILLFAYAFDDEPVRVVDLTAGEKVLGGLQFIRAASVAVLLNYSNTIGGSLDTAQLDDHIEDAVVSQIGGLSLDGDLSFTVLGQFHLIAVHVCIPGGVIITGCGQLEGDITAVGDGGRSTRNDRGIGTLYGVSYLVLILSQRPCVGVAGRLGVGVVALNSIATSRNVGVASACMCMCTLEANMSTNAIDGGMLLPARRPAFRACLCNVLTARGMSQCDAVVPVSASFHILGRIASIRMGMLTFAAGCTSRLYRSFPVRTGGVRSRRLRGTALDNVSVANLCSGGIRHFRRLSPECMERYHTQYHDDGKHHGKTSFPNV